MKKKHRRRSNGTIWAVEGCLQSLLWVEAGGRRVINGEYDVYVDAKGDLRNRNNEVRSFYVMPAPAGYDYNDVIDEAREIIRASMNADNTTERLRAA